MLHDLKTACGSNMADSCSGSLKLEDVYILES